MAIIQSIPRINGIKDEAPDICLICSSPHSASAHFGTISCLACAAFFRRTVALNITFECKKEHNCQIYYELRMICRACRYDKCIRAGMKRSCVQKRRVNEPKKKNGKKQVVDVEDDEDEDGPPPPKLFDTEFPRNPQTSLLLRKPQPVKVVLGGRPDDSLLPNSLPSDILPRIAPTSPEAHELLRARASTSVDLVDDDFDSPSSSDNRRSECSSIERPRPIYGNLRMTAREVLDFYIREEKKACDRRKIMFGSSPMDVVTRVESTFPYTTADLRPHTVMTTMEVFRFDHLLSFEFCKNLPGFNGLDQEEKANLYRNSCLGFCVLDIAYLSSRLQLHETEHIIVYTDATYSTVAGTGAGWDDEEIISSEQKRKLFLEINLGFYNNLILPMLAWKIDDVEYAALKALCLWKLGYFEYTPKIRTLAKENEAALFTGLHEYYRREGRRDGAERIGNIVLLLGNVFECYQAVLETYKKLDLFNLVKIDVFSRILINL